MDTTPTPAGTLAGTLTRSEVIDGVLAARAAQHDAALCELQLGLEWARLHPCAVGELPAQWGENDLFDEGLGALAALAGPGAPWVSEFAPVELAAALHAPVDTGRQLLADALELAHRLPRLWDLVCAGRVPVWRARLISRETHDLSVEAALFADRLIAATPEKIGLVNATRLVDEARLFFDPDRAADDEQHALARRGVWTQPGRTPATTEVLMTLDTPDAKALEDTIGTLAHQLHQLGDPEPLDIRRARAAGILADPQHALDLLSGSEPTRVASRGAGSVELFVHLTPTDLTRADLETGTGAGAGTGAGTGATTIERLGAVTTGLLTDWLTRHTSAGGQIRIRPVLDLTDPRAVDVHDPPEPMHEQVIQRDAHCVFPGCRHDSRSCDLDHTTAYVPLDKGGPPGQTSAQNLAPLCRTHHRVKTFTAWSYKRLDHGTYTWTSPTGHQYTVPPAPRRPPDRPRKA